MKFLIALLALTFAIGAFACGGGGKDKDEEKRIDTVRVIH